MRIVSTWRTDYAIRALIYMAQDHRAQFKALEIANAMKIPKGFLHQVLQRLQRSDIVVSRPSRYGGYSLSRPAEKISLAEVVEAMEGPLDAGTCVIKPELSRKERGCAMHSLWCLAHEAVGELLKQTTIDKLAAAEATLPANRIAACPVTKYLHEKNKKKAVKYL